MTSAPIFETHNRNSECQKTSNRSFQFDWLETIQTIMVFVKRAPYAKSKLKKMKKLLTKEEKKARGSRSKQRPIKKPCRKSPAKKKPRMNKPKKSPAKKKLRMNKFKQRLLSLKEMFAKKPVVKKSKE